MESTTQPEPCPCEGKLVVDGFFVLGLVVGSLLIGMVTGLSRFRFR